MRGAATLRDARQLDWGGVAMWLLAFGLVVYLGLSGGGYDSIVHDQVGIAAWWIVLVGVLVGALPRRPLGIIAWLALGLLCAFVLWTALSLRWTESAESTVADLALVATYLGVFALALFGRNENGSSSFIGAIAAGIVLISVVALLSRLHPAWFPTQHGTFLLESRERLSYPVNYWNGLAALIAIGLPLVLQIAAAAKSLLLRALAAAAFPAMALTVFFALSRSGIAAGAIALAVYLAFSTDRLPKALVALVVGIPSAILIAAADSRDALQAGLTGTLADHQASQMLTITLGICILTAIVYASASLALSRLARPSWTRVSRRQAWVGALVGFVVAVVLVLALGLPSRASNGWDEFRQGGTPGQGTNRLGSVAGQGRYQFWRSAVDENRSAPLTGTGAGTFEFWWARHANVDEIVRDTHSLYLQTLGELGIVGLAALVAFLLTILVGGGRNALAAEAGRRSWRAAALAGVLAFCLTAAVDWMWQIPVLVVSMLMLGGELVRPDSGSRRPVAGRPGIPWRIAIAVFAGASIVAIAIPLAATSFLRRSEADFRRSDLPAGLDAARTARNIQPYAASPRLQEALVLEAQGNLSEATAAAQAATEREPTNWRPWLVLSRIEAERGAAMGAVRDYRRARALNPRAAIFRR